MHLAQSDCYSLYNLHNINQYVYHLLMLFFLVAGSCRDRGITVCCRPDNCPQQMSPDGCFCDTTCHQHGDCCDDIDILCPTGRNDTKLVLCACNSCKCMEFFKYKDDESYFSLCSSIKFVYAFNKMYCRCVVCM